MLVRVLLALSNQRLESRLRRCLSGRSAIVSALPRGADLAAHLERGQVDIAFVRRRELLPRLELVARLRALPERPEVVVLTDREDGAERGALLAAGCLAVVSEALSDAALEEALRALLRRRRDETVGRLNVIDPQPQGHLDDFVSKSPVMLAFLSVVRRVVASDSSLLVLGETGVGKERLARAIHAEGPRRGGPFLAVNCSALSETLLESEIFGHEEGAFTGATRARRGLFELAHRGTIFLDEVGDMAPSLQAKLLRVVQDREILPVGGEEPVRVDVRIMAATNRDLARDVAEGRFRSDLYYRLGVVTLTLPPLRERREDIPALLESYVEHFRVRLGRGVRGIAPAALVALVRYDWPGNVRELVNVVERAVLLGSGPLIELEDLPPQVARAARQAPPAPGDAVPPPASPPEGAGTIPSWSVARAQALREFERRYLVDLMTACGGRIGAAAQLAGFDPRSLYDKLRRHGLRKEDFRGSHPSLGGGRAGVAPRKP